MMLIIISLQVNHLSLLLFLVERAANIMLRGDFKTMVTSITDGTDRFDMVQFMELCTLTSRPKTRMCFADIGEKKVRLRSVLTRSMFPTTLKEIPSCDVAEFVI